MTLEGLSALRASGIGSAKANSANCAPAVQTNQSKCDLSNFMSGRTESSFYVVEEGRDGLDLLLIQAVRDRRHNGRGVWVRWILAPFFVPIGQFVDDVVVQLTG
jgi:hypothetical protein